jgi:hypothetical protein
MNYPYNAFIKILLEKFSFSKLSKKNSFHEDKVNNLFQKCLESTVFYHEVWIIFLFQNVQLVSSIHVTRKTGQENSSVFLAAETRLDILEKENFTCEEIS